MALYFRLNHKWECNSRCSFVGTSTTKGLVVSTVTSPLYFQHKYTQTVPCAYSLWRQLKAETNRLTAETVLGLQSEWQRQEQIKRKQIVVSSDSCQCALEQLQEHYVTVWRFKNFSDKSHYFTSCNDQLILHNLFCLSAFFFGEGQAVKHYNQPKMWQIAMWMFLISTQWLLLGFLALFLFFDLCYQDCVDLTYCSFNFFDNIDLTSWSKPVQITTGAGPVCAKRLVNRL